MTDVLTVHGGTPLKGEIRVRGAKNLVSKAMVATLLAESPSRLRGVPEIADVRIVSGLLELHGVQVTPGPQHGELLFDPSNVDRAHVADIDAHAGSSRIPILLCGPLLHRLGRGLHPRPRWLPHRRPADRLPPRRAAPVRRGRREAP